MKGVVVRCDVCGLRALRPEDDVDDLRNRHDDGCDGELSVDERGSN